MSGATRTVFKAKKHLSFGSLIKALSTVFNSFSDSRWQKRIDYSLHDSMMSGFACMFFQEPSLVQYQRHLQEEQNRNNLETLFGVSQIPEDTQLRRLIDSVPSEHLGPIFKEYFYRLQRGKHLEQYQIFKNQYLCSIDGTQYHSSESIKCERCLRTKHKASKEETEREGRTIYSHKVLQAAIMHPDIKQVIPLMPEEICNSDGADKQDCEINAFKRLLPKIRKDHPQLEMIIVGDGIYSKQALIEKFVDNRTHFIFTAKEKDHAYLYEWLDAYEQLDSLSLVDQKGRLHVCQWSNDVPLHAKEDSISTNFFSYHIYSSDNEANRKINFKGTWVTDLKVSKDNVEKLIASARCRWKIENECFCSRKTYIPEIL
jgi:hypothetical protein